MHVKFSPKWSVVSRGPTSAIWCGRISRPRKGLKTPLSPGFGADRNRFRAPEAEGRCCFFLSFEAASVEVISRTKILGRLSRLVCAVRLTRPRLTRRRWISLVIRTSIQTNSGLRPLNPWPPPTPVKLNLRPEVGRLRRGLDMRGSPAKGQGLSFHSQDWPRPRTGTAARHPPPAAPPRRPKNGRPWPAPPETLVRGPGHPRPLAGEGGLAWPLRRGPTPSIPTDAGRRAQVWPEPNHRVWDEPVPECEIP